MSYRERGFSTLTGMLVVTGALLLAAVGTVAQMGMIKVSVHEKNPGGESFNIWVPAAVVPVVMAVVPTRHLEEAMSECAEDVGDWLPVLQAAVEGLEELPDAILVEVRSRDETVVIAIRNGKLVIDVDTSDEEVHVQVPLRIMDSVARKLERVTLKARATDV